MSAAKFITKVAMVGAGGNSGSHMAEAILATGKHTLTALTREGSATTLPSGVISKVVNYDDPKTLVDALMGQEALVVTLGVTTPKDTDMKLVNAAVEAGVKWIFPNEWGVDTDSSLLLEDLPMWAAKVALRDHIRSLDSLSFIAVTTGFWYEWSLAQPLAFGFDFAQRKVTLFDEGEVKMSVSTWPQVGRALAALLSLPIESNDGRSLTALRNTIVYVNSFTVSQRDMFSSVLRVTNTSESDWTITKVPANERVAQAKIEMSQGKRSAFGKVLYTRLFYPDGTGDFESHKGTKNGLLGLPKEDMDEVTKRAIKRSQEIELWQEEGPSHRDA